MKLNKTVVGGVTRIAVSGRIDSSSYLELEEMLDGLDYAGLNLKLDFTDVPYITSVALRVLLVCRKRLTKETMTLCNVSPVVMNVIDTSGFTDFFTFENDRVAVTMASLARGCAEKFGDSKKFFQNGVGYSWKEIDECSDIVASDLAKQGVTKGAHVAICSPNCVNWIITFFAIQKLNAIAILVNFTLKPDEIVGLSQIGDITHFCYGFLPGVKDYDAYLALVTGEGSQMKHTYSIHPAIDFRARIGEPVEIPAGEESDPDDLCMMIFTSGSTGKPKGALYSSMNLITSGNEQLRLFHVGDDDRICLFLPLFHIFGFGTSFLPALLCGASVYIPASTHPDVVLSTIADNKCTVFHSVPTMIFSIVKNPAFSPEKVASLRCSFMGGAPITEQQMTELMKIFPNNHFGNVYGMSEKPMISMTDYNDTAAHITQTIGKPAPGVEVEIRELGTGRVCAVGEIGEITVRSEGAMTSYYKLDVSKQALNADGWLPTGDLGYIGEDGYLRITGRCKELIIRAGENISPNEVAAAILRIEGVSDAKVFGAPDDLLGEKVVAAVALKEGASFDETAAKAFLVTKLAKAKVPEQFVTYEKFPILGTGKVDAVSLKKDTLTKLGYKA